MDRLSRLQWQLIALVVVAVAVVVWALKNSARVVLYVFPGVSPVEAPLAMVIASAFFAGLFISFALAFWTQKRLRRRIKTLERQITEEAAKKEACYSHSLSHEKSESEPNKAEKERETSSVHPVLEEDEGEALAPGMIRPPSNPDDEEKD